MSNVEQTSNIVMCCDAVVDFDVKDKYDLVVCDPPYNIGYDYGDEFDDKQSVEAYTAFSSRWLTKAHAALHATGALWLIIGDEWAAELKVIARSVGFSLRSWVIWYYTFGVNCENKFTRSHTHCLYMVKDRKNFKFNTDAIKVPSARQLVYNDKRAKAGGRLPDDTWVLLPQQNPAGWPQQHDTWCIPRLCGTHKERVKGIPTQLPELLVSRIVRACTDPGDSVLDLMAGSGTVGTVCKKLRRHSLSIEQSVKYANFITDRLAGTTPGDSITGEEASNVK